MPRETVTIRPSEGPPLTQFIRGLSYPFRGAAFLWRHKDLWDVAIGPLLITVGMILCALWVALGFGDNLLALFWPQPDPAVEPGSALVWEVTANLTRFALFCVLAVLFWVIGNMLGAPFWDVLAERTERHLLDRPERRFDMSIALGDAYFSVKHSLAYLALWIAVMIPLVLVNFVPVVGSVAYAILSWMATLFFVVREIMDVPLSRRRTPFAEKLKWIRANGPVLTGLGASSTLLFLVPLMNVLVMPIAVMGGTLLYCHLHLEGRGVPQRGPGGRPEDLPAPAAAE